MNREIDTLKRELNIIDGIDYTSYDQKIRLIKENLKNIKLLNIKSTYLEKRGFHKLTEVRYNNSGILDDEAIGKDELYDLIDKLVQEQALKKTFYICFTGTDQRTSYICFYIRNDPDQEQ